MYLAINFHCLLVAGEKTGAALVWRICRIDLPLLGKSLVFQLKRGCLLPHGKSSF